METIDIQRPIGPVHPKLGRYLVRDSRSAQWTHDAQQAQRGKRFATFKPVEWTPNVGGILDQSNLDTQGIKTSQIVPGVTTDYAELGSCTGNGTVYAASIVFGPDLIKEAGFDISDTTKSEETAIQWYSKFTFADDLINVNFPDTDCGSSGLGACRTMKNLGLATSYVHAEDAEAVCSLMQTGPVIAGIPWFSAFFEPDRNGFIDADPRWLDSALAGGHEICWAVLEKVAQTATGRIIPEKTVIAFPNSWNSSWGDEGYGRIRLSTYNMLRSAIDVQQFRRTA